RFGLDDFRHSSLSRRLASRLLPCGLCGVRNDLTTHSTKQTHPYQTTRVRLRHSRLPDTRQYPLCVGSTHPAHHLGTPTARIRAAREESDHTHRRHTQRDLAECTI